jgi:predicted Zn-dependent peptidase
VAGNSKLKTENSKLEWVGGWGKIRAMLSHIARRVSSSLILAGFFCSALAVAPSAGLADEISAQGPVGRSLPSGAKALLWPRPGSGTVLITVAVPAGSEDEPEGMGGLSHYLEHLLFDGFDELDERGVTEAFERLSAYMNAFTREQATVYFALVPREDAVAAAELMAGMLSRSSIGAEVYEKEKKVILEELAKDHASPNGLREERLREVLWGGTPLEHPVGGSVESVGATTREEVIRYWKARYRPSGFRLLITGDLPIEGLAAVLEPFAELTDASPRPVRSDSQQWKGWGEWAAGEAPEAPAEGGGMPSMGMGHGMPGKSSGPAGGTLKVVIAAPDSLATSSTPLEVVARWLSHTSGPLVSALGPEWAQDLSVARLPREHRDLLEIRVEASIGVDSEELLSRTLGALDAAAAGPADAEAFALQRAWAGERALNDQRLHYAAVFYGEALASARGDLAESVAPSQMEPEAVRAAAGTLLTEARPRTRAAWLGEGGPEGRTALPVPVAAPVREQVTALESGPLGSLTATLGNGVVVGILPEVGSEVFGIHLLVADRTLREPADFPGVSDLAHRLLLGGTALSASGEIARRIERAGIDVKTADSPSIPFDNRYHVPDFSYIRIEGPARSLGEALMMLAEMVRAPTWDEEGWRSAVTGHGSAKKADNRGSEKALQLFFESLLGPDHPLSRPVSGPQGEITSSSEDVKAFWGQWPTGYFVPDRLVVTVASPRPAEETLELVEGAFSGGPAAQPARGPYPVPVAAGEATEVEIGEAPQVTLLWGRLAEVAPEDRASLLVAMDALSDRMTAIVREREGLAYRLGAGVRPIPGGRWILSARVGTRPENSQRVAELLETLVAELGTDRLSDGDLERLNARARRTRMLRGLSAASRAYRVGRALFEGPGSPLAIDEASYAAVTPEQVRQAVSKYLVAGEMMLIVTP